MRLKGKVAFITGSTRGIGAAMATRFAAEGAAVAIIGRNEQRGQTVAKEIEAAGGSALYVKADVGVESDIEHAISSTVERFDRIDILVNNAAPTDMMGQATKPLTAYSSAEFDEIMKVGIYGAFWCLKHALPVMERAGGGSVINISSQAAVQGIPGTSAYACAKGALNALTRQVAVDYGAAGIRSNVIVLGVVVNELTSGLVSTPELVAAMNAIHLTRLGDCDDIAALALYLASDESGFITGTEIRADGGASIKASLITDHVQIGLSASKSPAS